MSTTVSSAAAHAASAPAAALTSFLTEEQRAALDAALKSKAAEAKVVQGGNHKTRNSTGDRKAKSGRLMGGPKKGGAGTCKSKLKIQWSFVLTTCRRVRLFIRQASNCV